MIRGIYTAVSGLITGEAKQSVINNNIANANTIGYKSEELLVKKFDDVLIKNYDKVIGDKNVKNTVGSLSLGSEIDDVIINYEQGVTKVTDVETDFALDGRGFFSFMTSDGITQKELYGRDGHFHINSKGYLVNNIGDKVMGINIETGNEEEIYIGDGKIRLNQEGKLRINDKEKYKFKLVDFEDYSRTKKVGDNYYSSESTIDVNDISVMQNKLEQSNVNVTDEMINMMAVLKNFESNQKVVQALDETLSKSVNEIGRIR